MTYFVTGGTGFIGRRLIAELVKKRGTVYFLVRRKDPKVLAELYEFWGVDKKRAVPVTGDLVKKHLGVSKSQRASLHGKIRHFYHLAAMYDITAPAEVQEKVNVDGTRHAVQLAETLNAGCFDHISSIAAAGLYEGVFREDMFAEATGMDKSPYHRTKHESEGVVRAQTSVPWRIYRPGIVVGDSRTGEMDKIDGPYYFFKAIQKMRAMLPAWVPTIGVEGGRINIVPVDFVVAALVHISHLKGLHGQCFHLTDPDPKRIGDALNIFAKAGHAPSMAMRINARMFNVIPDYVLQGLWMLTPVRRIVQAALANLDLPIETLKFVNYPTLFDSRNTQQALQGTGIAVPDLESYAYRLWDYWERNLDPDLFVDRSLAGRVRGKVVLVTGASSGIGRATALKFAGTGAKIILVARSPDKLEEARQEIADMGGDACSYTCDISNLDDCDRLTAQVIEDHGGVDILVNNAGRSIRRGIASSFDRFHDFERTMQLNYFGALRLIMNLLPKMIEHKRGHIINISSIGVLSNAPRFSAYVASKAALDAFTRCAASELSHNGIHFTTINMPLVRTPMIAPTKLYNNVPTISSEEAAEMIIDAIIHRPKRVATRLGISAEIMHLLAPKLTELGMNEAFQLFPDSAAAQGKSDHQTSPEQIAVAQLTRGIHW